MQTFRTNRCAGRPAGLTRLLAFVVCGALVVAACSSDGGTNRADNIDDVLARSSAAMAGVETVEFEIEQTGADVFIDDDGLIQFVSATGRFAAPSSADALVDVAALGLNTTVGAVAIDGQVWITNPLTGDWEPAPSGFSFDPTDLFAPETGWSSLLGEGLQDPELVSEGSSTDEHHVRGTVGADRVTILTGGLVDEPSLVDIWVDADSDLVSRASFDVDTDDGPTSWTITLRDYGSDVTINEPDLDPNG